MGASSYAKELLALVERTPMPAAISPVMRSAALTTKPGQTFSEAAVEEMRAKVRVGDATAAEAEATAAASVYEAMAQAAAEATAARARAEAAVSAANRRAAAEIAEVRSLAKAAVKQAREEAAQAVREANAEARAARHAMAAVEEELRRERAKAKEQRASHQSEIERWRSALVVAQKQSQRYRERNSYDAFADVVVSQPRAASSPPSPPQPRPRPPPPPPPPSQEQPAAQEKSNGGDGLLDRIVLSRHLDYFNTAPLPRERQSEHQQQVTMKYTAHTSIPTARY